jgi:NADH dehydrogenase
VPFGIASLKAMFLQLLPNPLLTVDQVRLLKKDNVVSTTAAGLSNLGITPTSVEAVVPSYLWRYRAKGEYADQARRETSTVQ